MIYLCSPFVFSLAKNEHNFVFADDKREEYLGLTKAPADMATEANLATYGLRCLKKGVRNE